MCKPARANLPAPAMFASWRAVAFELRFEPDCLHGLGWIQSPAAQEEIGRLCSEARAPSPPPSPRRDANAA